MVQVKVGLNHSRRILLPDIKNLPQREKSLEFMDTESGCNVTVGKAPSNEQCINRLLTFQTIFGITYFGRYLTKIPGPFEYFLRPLILIFLVCYQLSSIIFLFSIHFYFDANQVIEEHFETLTKKKALKVIFELTSYAMLWEFMMLQLFSFFRGPLVADILYHIGPKIRLYGRNYLLYVIIYPAVIFLIVIGCSSPVVLFEKLWIDWKYPMLGVVLFGWEGVLGAVNKAWVFTVHLYASAIICQTIDDFHENLFNYSNYGVLLSDILALRRRVNRLNKLLSKLVLMKIVLNCVMLSSFICALVERFQSDVRNPKIIITLLCMIAQVLICETGSCLASQSIQNRMSSLIDSIQELIARNSIDSAKNLFHSTPKGMRSRPVETPIKTRLISEQEQYCLQQICSMQSSMGFQVCDIFVLKSVTMVVICSNVLNYAILLIQTTG